MAVCVSPVTVPISEPAQLIAMRAFWELLMGIEPANLILIKDDATSTNTAKPLK